MKQQWIVRLIQKTIRTSIYQSKLFGFDVNLQNTKRKMVNNEIFDAFKQHILKCSRGTSFVYYLCCVITLLKTINHAISRKNCRTKRDCVYECGQHEIKIIPIRFHSIHLT